MKSLFLILSSFFAVSAFSQSTIIGNQKVFGNIQSTQNILDGYASIATTGGTSFFTVLSPGQVYFTGTLTQTAVLPAVNTLILGQSYTVVNKSSGVVTVQSSGANTLQAMASNTQLVATVVSISGTGTASWSWAYYPQNSGSVTSVALTVPSFLSITGSPITTSGTLAISLSGTALPLANGGTGQTSKAAAFDALSPMTTGGDIIYGGASGTGTRLANGSAGQILQSNGTTLAPTWVTNTAGAAAYNYTSQTANYGATINDYVKASGASFAITLPTAIGVGGKGIWIEHDGTSLTQVYTINTTSAQTINVNGTAVASGGFVFQTQGEKALFISNGATWEMAEHYANTGWISGGLMADFYTFTVTSANATLAATYVPAYVFTITAGNTASVAAVFSNNGNNYTLAKALLVGDTTVVFTGAAAPTASGTLTYVSGTHTGGNLSFSAVAGNANTSVFSVASTIAAQTTLVTASTSSSPNSSGQLVKTAGTGDAVVVYSAVTGNPYRYSGTTTDPIFNGAPTVNSVRWMRRGNMATIWTIFASTSAGVVGSGDYIFPMPQNMLIDTTVIPAFTGGTAQATQGIIVASLAAMWPTATGWGSGANFWNPFTAAPYTSSSYRIYGEATGFTSALISPGSSVIPASQQQGLNWQVTFPISGWQP